MSGAEEEWVKAAITDDTIVVELLMRLHAAAPPPPPLLLKRATLPLEWTVRQRRSKPVLANTNPKKPAQSQRASPTTPLSWSGATSISGGSGGAGAGGSEESSRPHIQKVARSKVNGDSEKTVSKRSRKKKQTLAELKDEESSLLKERRELKRKLVALCMNLEKQRAKNENLKRMKIELQPLPDREITSVADKSISDQLQPKTTSSSPISPITPPIVLGEAATLQSSTSNGCSEANAGAASDSTFVLPDLNIPFEEDPCPDVIRGIS